MRIATLSFLILVVTASYTARATYNATATGTVAIITQMGVVNGMAAETIAFTISPMPAAVPGAQFQQFVISPNSVPDPQTRRNMVALLLSAKATGTPVEVAYDNLGGFLDQQLIGVYFIEAL